MHNPHRFYRQCDSQSGEAPFYFFFDMDGTLCDSEEIYALALQATIKQMVDVTISVEQASAYAFGRSVNDVMHVVFGVFNIHESKQADFMSAMVANYGELKSKHADKFLISSTVNLFKHLVDEGYPVCIVSGSTREDIAAVLKLMNVDENIPYFGTEDYQRGKPHPEPYLTAAEYFRIPRDQYKNIIVIEDSPVGVRSGCQAGMHVIGLQASSLSVSLQDEGAHVVVNKKEIGAECGADVSVDLIEWMQSHLQLLSPSNKNMNFRMSSS